MALPPIPFGRRASQGAIISIAPPDVDSNIDSSVFSQERNRQHGIAPQNIWAHAIPCPYKYWYTVEPFGNANPLPYVQRVTSDPRRAEEIPAGKYFVPHYEVGGQASGPGFFSDTVITSRSFTATMHLGARIDFRLPQNGDTIVVTFTVTGTGGYSVVRTYPNTDPLSAAAIVLVDIPTPWDEDRTVTLTWTGGGTTMFAPYAYAPSGIVLTTDIPGGAVATTGWDGRRGSMKDYDSKAALPMTAVSIREHHRYGPYAQGAGLIRRVYDANLGGNSVINYVARGSVLGTFGMRSLFYTPPSERYQYGTGWIDRPTKPGDAEAPYVGLPVRHAGAFMVTSVAKPQAEHYIQLRRCVRLYFSVRASTAGTYTVLLVRGADWGNNFILDKVTVASITVSHAGGDVVQFYLYPGPYPIGPSADGAYIGLSYVEAPPGSGITVGAWAIDDYLPSPITIPTTDNKAIPASVVVSSLSAPKGAAPLTVSGVSFPFSAVPADVGLYFLKYVDVPRGAYYVSGRTAADVGTGVAIFPWGTSEVSDIIDSVPAFMVEAGDPVFVLPPHTEWGNYKKSTRTDRTVETVKLMSVIPVHNALALGDNDISLTFATWGYASAADRTAIGMLFQKFTAATTGRFEFKLWSSVVFFSAAYNLGIWASLTDQLCIHDPPEAHDIGLTNSPLWYEFRSGPPVNSGGAGLRQYIVQAGIGEWLGQDGKRASGYYSGVVSVPIIWRFDELPQGWNVADPGNVVKRLAGTTFVPRNISRCVYSANLTAGQTIHLRVAAVRSRAQMSTRYGRSVQSVLASGFYRLTVTDVT